MLTVTLAVLALCVACVIVWFAVRRSNAVQRVSGSFSGPVEQMQEQILMTADSAVDRLDGKIAQMEILLSEIDRRSNILAQQIKQLQLQQLQSEQQQQQQAVWFQTQRQQLEKDFLLRQQAFEKIQPVANVMPVAQITPQAFVQPVESPREMKTQQEPPKPKVAKIPKVPAAVNNPPAQDKRATILEMAEQGFSETDIAQKMGIGKGEVMLLLKLRKKAAH